MKQSPVLRWIAWFLVAVVFAIACVFLANWQLNRRAEAVAKMQRVVDNYDRPAISLAEIPQQGDVTVLEWQPVQIQGNYIYSKQLLVRNRPIAGQPGFLQLVPFRTESGEILIIERGWIPADSNLKPSKEYPLSDKSVLVLGRIRLGEQSPNRISPAPFVTSINLTDIQALIGEPNESRYYLRLISEQPPQASYPQPIGKPLLDEGNHLSYAVQWIIFAVMGFIALFWAIRQERDYQKMARDPSYVPRKRKRKSASDDEIEDQLLDSSKPN